jgi:hypothetical protein
MALQTLLIDPDHGLYKSINIHEVSTFNLKIYIVMQSSFWIFQN